MKLKELILIILPSILWFISFGIFYNFFLYGIFISTIILGLYSIVYFRHNIILIRNNFSRYIRYNIIFYASIGIILSFILYLIFYAGDILLNILNLGYFVNEIYAVIQSNYKILLIMSLIIIGLFEEIYWRGSLQEFVSKRLKGKFREGWIIVAIYYTLVHLPSLNFALLAAAFTIGFINGFTASRLGILTTIIAHILWLELVMVLYPL
jgi:membrane protease YdiL (CAAX protease family)